MDNVSIKMSKNKEAINSQTIQHTISRGANISSTNENNNFATPTVSENNNGTKW